MPEAKKAKLWNDADMISAINAVKDSGMSCRAAAVAFNVPKSTLNDRLSGRVVQGCRMGPDTVLTPEDEKQLADYFVDISNQGYEKCKETIIYMATAKAIKYGKAITGGSLSRKWWRGFNKRHPEISGIVRTVVTRSTIECFYQRLLEAITVNSYGKNIKDSPALIFYCNENEFELNTINRIVAEDKGVKYAPKGLYGKVTVLSCASAAGNGIPPSFVFKNLYGRIPKNAREDTQDGNLFMALKSSWIDKDIYLKWFNEMFLPSIPSERPVLLIVDGHKAHITLEMIQTAVENQVMILCLPSHSSQLLQPLDLSLSGPFKRGCLKAYAEFNRNTPVMQRNFTRIFNRAWHLSVTPEIIKSGFQRSGIYPFDPSVFNFSKLPNPASAEDTQDPLSTQQPGISVPLSLQSPIQPSVQMPQSPIQPSSVQTPGSCKESCQFLNNSLMHDLASLERIIGKDKREKFRKRFEDGYALRDDTLYNQWHQLFVNLGGETNKSSCPCNGACSCSCKGLGYCECLDIEMLTSLGAEVVESSSQKARGSSQKRKRSFDQGNKSGPGEVTLQSLKSEKKEKEMEEKEQRRKEKIEKKKIKLENILKKLEEKRMKVQKDMEKIMREEK